ncbi:hypothetical protein GOBAR_AA07501 [Gossypium barbadense]|uniref:Uncharacterized protein n=1 Tax=Gossypium barbadense TaxID=3634 RepID=A0A2P5YC20_GOSBA|nr:hypothetical protein GOBAR_AA07501 [Gossypium barbadense]
MRVPVCSPQANHYPIPKPDINNNNITITAGNITFLNSSVPASSCEPTLELDLRRSPSSAVTENPVLNPTDNSNCFSVSGPHQQQAGLEWDEHVLRNMDWDAILKDFGLDDESVPATKTIPPQVINPRLDNHIQNVPELTSCELTHHPLHSDFNLYESYSGLNQNPSHNNYFDVSNTCNFHNVGNFNLGFDFLEDLIRAANCFDTHDLQHAQVILDRLHQRLRSPSGKPLQRAAFYFKEALQSLFTGSTWPNPVRLSSWSEIVQTIEAYKSFSGINPIPMFNHFTTNQALLEALDESAPLIHIIDFDIGFGGQYASLMREMAERNDHSRKFIRITAVVPEEYGFETRLIEDNLNQFAQALRLRKNGNPSISVNFRCLGLQVAAFVSDLRRISPSVVVFVDSEVWMESGTTTSFRKNFVNCLEFYAMMFESLDAAGGEWVRKIETLLLRPRIFSAVEAAARTAAQAWREVFCEAGMRAVRLSQLADFLAESLLQKVQVRGFHVAKRQAELVLCWHKTALIATLEKAL